MTAFWAGVAAYTIWGLFPVYWKLIQHAPALQILGHRIVWSSCSASICGDGNGVRWAWRPLASCI